MRSKQPVRVVHFQRRPQCGQFSIERVFAAIRTELPRDINVRVFVLRFPSRGVWRRVYNMIEATLHQSDVNHVTGDVHFLTLLLCRGKTLLTIHDSASLERLRGLRREILRLLWYVIPIWRSAIVTVDSESAKTELLRHVRCAPDSIVVVPACLSPSFEPYPKPFNSACPRILHVGTAANKNLPRVVCSLAGIDCELEIVGELDAEQKRILASSGLRYRASERLNDEEMIEAYHRCDLLVFASTYEGFGLPIVEANAIGRPVVASNILSMPEVAGEAACLVDPFDAASMRAGIQRVIEDRDYRETLVSNGFANAQRFTAATVAADYVALYRRLGG